VSLSLCARPRFFPSENDNERGTPTVRLLGVEHCQSTVVSDGSIGRADEQQPKLGSTIWPADGNDRTSATHVIPRRFAHKHVDTPVNRSSSRRCIACCSTSSEHSRQCHWQRFAAFEGNARPFVDVNMILINVSRHSRGTSRPLPNETFIDRRSVRLAVRQAPSPLNRARRDACRMDVLRVD
jgi:hypothetical protein